MKKRTKWIIGILVVVGAGGGVAAKMANRGVKPVQVRIEPVEERDLTASVTASGKIQPHTKADLSAEISGKITKLDVKEGDWVKTGQFLLQIDPQQFEAGVQRAEATLASSRAQQAESKAGLTQAQRSLDRIEALKKANASMVSAEQLEEAKTTVEVQKALAEASEFRARQSEADLRNAKWQLEQTTIRAPMTGRVTRLNVEVGETAIQGTLNRDAAILMTISDLSVLETKIRVDETDVVRISLGDSAQVQIDAFPDTTFAGKVVKVSNSSVRTAASNNSDQAVDYEVTIQLVNPPHDTRPDLSATAKVVTDSRTKVLSIPIIALTVREDSAMNQQAKDQPVTVGGTQAKTQVGKRDIEGVFVVGTDNKVAFRPVKVGIAGERYFEVLSGLKKGERIVGGTYQAIRELKDGALIKENTGPAGTTPTTKTPSNP